jgi:hypothetical protein
LKTLGAHRDCGSNSTPELAGYPRHGRAGTTRTFLAPQVCEQLDLLSPKSEADRSGLQPQNRAIQSQD